MFNISEIKEMEVKEISELEALELIFENHYSKIMPRLSKHFLGGYVNNELVAVMTLGWGVQPLNTIKNLFPSLGTGDYYEIGKMCLLEEMPKNSESIFISKVLNFVKNNYKHIKLIFTWADGILGKPGYVYQASNFLYGGYISTDLYISENGEKVHPRTAQGIMNDRDGFDIGRRPDNKFLVEHDWNHYRGKQFRYVYFLCNRREKKRLLKETEFDWNQPFPKDNDIAWKKKNLEDSKWYTTDNISYIQDAVVKYNKTVLKNKDKINKVKNARKFFDF
tara:strand:+ start:998 stop:1831 length:834 start_codon:yes stop_codon:yes gene_type:complete